MTPAGDPVIVHKCDSTGREVWTWRAVVRGATPASVQLEARFNGRQGVLAGLAFRQGDRFLETYFADRWYNVFALFDVDTHQLKGWYCNITRPARFADGHIHFEDLELDLIVLPDGTTHVLDQDEFDRLPLTEAERAAARDSLEELQRLAQEQAGPFAMPR